MCVVPSFVMATSRSTWSLLVRKSMIDVFHVLSRTHRRYVRNVLATEVRCFTRTMLYNTSAASRVPHRQMYY